MNTKTMPPKKETLLSQATGSQTIVLWEALQQPHIQWILSAYKKQADQPSSEQPLPGINAATLQSFFGQPQDNPMYDVYPVSKEQANQLQAYVEQPIDLQTYDYFVECSAE